MSADTPDSVPTSHTSRSAGHRPSKKRALTPVSQQSAQVEALFAHPDRPISLPSNTVSKTLAPPPEIVSNVQGSSAGAGSGEFHVYKASRRREYERLRVMDEEVAREEADAEFEAKRLEREKKDEELLAKNRAKREKAKARRAKGKGGVKGDGVETGEGTEVAVKKKLGARKVEAQDGNGNGVVEGRGEVVEGEQTAGGEEGGGITIHDED